MIMTTRTASHADSWYTANPSRLSQQLQGWLEEVPHIDYNRPARAIIAPHAGYSYSGPTAAFAGRVFILGPSHHHYLSGCALTKCKVYATPLGSLTVDTDGFVKQLHDTEEFEWMSQDVDEAEHSIEMHLPYLFHVMRNRSTPYTIVPILVGNLSKQAEIDYGKLLAPYLADRSNFFIISSDFCHWGRRFSYQHYDNVHGAIHQSIEALDRDGMALIEQLNADGFYTYLKEKRNTICGRHPIAVLLRAIDQWKQTDACVHPQILFTHYAQSNHVMSPSDSSVSYASAIVYDSN